MPDPTKNYKMAKGSKEKNTPTVFSEKHSAIVNKAYAKAQKNDSISRAGTDRKDKMIRERINNPPNSTDSLAVYMRNNNGATIWSKVANAAEKKYGKIDVSGFDIRKPRKTNAKKAFEKYNIK
jgi:hypothetical protein